MKPVSSPQAEGATLFSPNFLLAWVSSFLFFGSFYLLLPTLPLYVLWNLGGKESEIGLIIGVFTISAVLVRPFAGRLADERGRKGLMLLGALVFFLSSPLYIFTATVPWLLGLRLFHGIGIAAFTTGAMALVADLAPAARRGEAMGFYGMSPNLAMLAIPALGIVILNAYGFLVLFLLATGLAFLSFLLCMPIAERRSPVPAGSVSRASLFSRSALSSAFLVFCLSMTYAAVISFIPLFATKHELGNPGLFFMASAATLILVRAPAGKASDKYGRASVLVPGMAAVGVSMILLPLATPLWAFLAVAGLYGLGFGAVQPTLVALVVDRVGAKERGAAMGTFTAAFDVGIGLGSILWGVVLQWAGFGAMFLSAGLMALLGMAYYLIRDVAGGARRAKGETPQSGR